MNIFQRLKGIAVRRAPASAQKGATMIEYALIAALIAVVAVTAVTTVGTKVTSTFTSVAGKLT